MNENLLDLARANGVVLEYYDIWGKLHHASEGSLRAILAAMGIEADGDPAVVRSLRATMRARWLEILPPAAVVRAGASPWTLRLTLPAALDSAALRWSVRAEDGALHQADFSPHTLDRIEATDIDAERRIARALRLDLNLPQGYHQLSIYQGAALLADTLLSVTPARCYWPLALNGEGRVWGVAAQLYAVRSERNWGIGDFSDLRALVQQWGERGSGVVGLNPLHALYPHNPAHASPYSPSSRLFKNWIYIDPEASPDFGECEPARRLVRSAAFRIRLNALRATELVDYLGVASAKREVMDLLYAHFRRHHLPAQTERGLAFRGFQAAGGEDLRRHALFEALQEHLSRNAPAIWGWPAWPEAYRDPASAAVERFCSEHLVRVEFFAYLQWLADQQYAAAAMRSDELGLGIGIYEDLAVSIDRGGAEGWANQDIYALSASVGAPPDDFNLHGQDWGLPPVIPERLRQTRYASFIATLRANMRHSGALRIDHVMQLMRLFWVPPGGKAADGLYVRYPFEDLLGLLALESERNRCLVIGEDLGTVPDEVRHALGDAGVLSYKLLYFERRHGGDFKPPGEYPAQAIVAATTHDLPTLAGWWEGHDLDLRARLGLYPDDAMHGSQTTARVHDRARLLAALEREGMLPDSVPNGLNNSNSSNNSNNSNNPDNSYRPTDPASYPVMTPALSCSVHAYLAASPAKVLVVQLEDVLGATEQVNLPGTTDQYPNWRRKLPWDLERIAQHERFAQLADTLARSRPRS